MSKISGFKFLKAEDVDALFNWWVCNGLASVLDGNLPEVDKILETDIDVFNRDENMGEEAWLEAVDEVMRASVLVLAMFASGASDGMYDVKANLLSTNPTDVENAGPEALVVTGMYL